MIGTIGVVAATLVSTVDCTPNDCGLHSFSSENVVVVACTISQVRVVYDCGLHNFSSENVVFVACTIYASGGRPFFILVAPMRS